MCPPYVSLFTLGYSLAISQPYSFTLEINLYTKIKYDLIFAPHRKLKQNFSREAGVKAQDWVSEKCCSILGSTTHLLWELVEQDIEQEWRP